MKRLSGMLPFFALLFGIIGLLLRRWQLTSCFDPQGLPIPGAAITLLTAVTAAVMVFFLLSTYFFREKKDWLSCFGSHPTPLLFLPAVGSLLSGGLFLRSVQQQLRSTTTFAYAGKLLPVLMGVGCVITAVGLISIARGGKSDPLLLMLPGFGSCFWVVNAYNSHASNPVVSRFGWLMLAVVFTSFAWYHLAGFALHRGRLRRTLFFSLTAVFLCLLCLAGGETPSDQVMLASQAAALTLITRRLTAR